MRLWKWKLYRSVHKEWVRVRHDKKSTTKSHDESPILYHRIQSPRSISTQRDKTKQKKEREEKRREVTNVLQIVVGIYIYVTQHQSTHHPPYHSWTRTLHRMIWCQKSGKWNHRTQFQKPENIKYDIHNADKEI